MIKNALIRLRQKIKTKIIRLMYKILMLPVRHADGRVLFGEKELGLVHKALLSQNLFGVDGKMVGDFEKNFAQLYGVPYAVASTSGTAAIHTAIAAINIEPGDEVITAPITDLGTIIPIINQGGIPVFADIDESYNMDPADIERKVTDRTKAILVVHLFGNPCDMDAIMAIKKKHNLIVIEDCCQAHVTEYKGRYVGTIGDIGCFSFQQSKHMTTGDGGMTITNNPDYYEFMKLFVDKGFARKGWGARAYIFHGQNYRMNEVTAAVGLAQLEKVKNVVKKRNELGTYMTSLLQGIDGIQTCPATEGAIHSYWLYPLYFESTDLERIAKELKKEWIRGSIGYTVKPIYLCTDTLTKHKTYGNSQYPFTWKSVDKTYTYEEGLCPKAEETLKHLFCINWNECWTKERVEKTAEGIRKVCENLNLESEKQPEDVPQPAKTSAKKVGDSGKVRIGIIGCGLMGNMHLTALKTRDDVEIAGYADPDNEKLGQIALRVQANTYPSHKELLANEKLDAVTICTVPSTHYEIVMDALEAGVDVLCEKPLAVSVEEAKAMTQKANEKNKLLMTAFKFRFFKEVQEAKKLIDQGQLGKITHFRVMFGGYLDMTGSWYAKKDISGGGIIMDNGPHAIDLIQYLLGDVDSATSQLRYMQNLEVEDTASMSLNMKNGAHGSVDISWSTSIPSKHYFEIYGENGTALLDLNGITYKFKTWNEFRRIDNNCSSKDSFALQFGHFVESIKSRQPSIIQNDTGLKTQKVIEAIYQNSSKTEPKSTLA